MANSSFPSIRLLPIIPPVQSTIFLKQHDMYGIISFPVSPHRISTSPSHFSSHLVDAVVGEVHEDVADAAAVVGVLVRGEAHQAVVVEVDAQRVHARQQHVQAQVKLGSVDQVGTSHVPVGKKKGFIDLGQIIQT
jgi:hypothetical protein